VLIDDYERNGLAAFVRHFDNLEHVVFAPPPEHLLAVGDGDLVLAVEAEDINDGGNRSSRALAGCGWDEGLTSGFKVNAGFGAAVHVERH
jgi:hypothetical protein